MTAPAELLVERVGPGVSTVAPGDQVLNVGTREGWADTEDI